MASNRKSIEKARMEAAFRIGNTKNYKNKVNKLPAMLQNNGVGNTLAFLSSKNEWKDVIEDITVYLKTDSQIAFKEQIGDDLMNCVINLNDSEIKALQIELFNFINWLRRFAKGD